MKIDKGYLKTKCKVLLNINDTTLYDDKLDILVGGAINKLKNEGVENIYDQDEDNGYDYTLCVAYMVALDLDLVADYNRLYTQYMTRVVTLREKQKYDRKR